MKSVRVFGLSVLVFLMVVMNSSCNKKVASIPPVTTESIISQPIGNTNTKTTEVLPEKLVEPVKNIAVPANEKFASYQIMKTSTSVRKDQGQALFVLIPAINLDRLDERNYVIRVKNLIKQLVVYEKRAENISVFVFDNQAILEKIFLNNQSGDQDVASHYIARYDATPAEGVYQNTLLIFPVAPKNNPVILEQTDIIQFNPYDW